MVISLKLMREMNCQMMKLYGPCSAILSIKKIPLKIIPNLLKLHPLKNLSNCLKMRLTFKIIYWHLPLGIPSIPITKMKKLVVTLKILKNYSIGFKVLLKIIAFRI